MSDFPEKAEDKVNTVGVVIIGLSTTALLWATVLALQAYFQSSSQDIDERRAARGLTAEYRSLKAEQLRSLSQTQYADAQKGTLKRLAIEDAMKLVVRDAKAGAPTLIPTLGELNVPTVPAVSGKPADGAVAPAPAPAPEEGAAPAEGEAPAEGAAPAEGEAPAEEGAEAAAAPAEGAALAPAKPAEPAAAPADGATNP